MDTNRTALTWRQVLIHVLVLQALFTMAGQRGALQKAERISTRIARSVPDREIADLATQVKGAFVELRKSRGAGQPPKEDVQRLLVRLEAKVRSASTERSA
jgi:hypothetical protein